MNRFLASVVEWLHWIALFKLGWRNASPKVEVSIMVRWVAGARWITFRCQPALSQTQTLAGSESPTMWLSSLDAFLA